MKKAKKVTPRDTRIHVDRFFVQPTKSFDVAPQREEYDTDENHLKACRAYAVEWRDTYVCTDKHCCNSDCPQHSKLWSV